MSESTAERRPQAEGNAAPPRLRVRVDSTGRRAVRRFLRHRPGTIALLVLALMVLAAIAAPLIQRYSPSAIDLRNASAPPNATHWLGTDGLGRDVWSRTIHGGRVSLSVGIVAALVTATVGTIVGAVAGFSRGIVDATIMRFVDLLMVLPQTIILLVLVMVVGPGLINLLIILPLIGWPGTCRLMRAQVLSVREMDYVLAARCLGDPDWAIIIRHVLPNAFVPVLVSLTMSVGGTILAEAGVSFLGLGVQPPTASWGNMLNEATHIFTLQNLPWIWLPPGIMVVIVVICVNFLGDALRDAIDPRMTL